MTEQFGQSINVLNIKMKKFKIIQKLCLFLILLAVASITTFAIPNGVSVLKNESTFEQNYSASAVLNVSGGTISNLTINATTQNQRWKGFVGQVKGTLALADASSNSLFDWQETTVSGQIYATRNSSMLTWADVKCAEDIIITNEETNLNITSSNPDSVFNTFSTRSHREFYVGVTQIQSDSCRSVALNVNGSVQTSKFQEMVLQDGSNIIYSSMLENRTYGFNGQFYDFQMIVPENALPGLQSSTAYYFYLELV
jgi:hypothetical protein